ncbi:hypothetical protein T4A_4060 [Trichinella pseudospiralis]|uniref:Uncharacterized protein n=1 Tax=Trichinella pseudospiralis TaxID=6337 RepID=A0A0V1E971_TRIPS|nr:hypothetical protein T4A_4060 [Trichinella pseudospiralis]
MYIPKRQSIICHSLLPKILKKNDKLPVVPAANSVISVPAYRLSYAPLTRSGSSTPLLKLALRTTTLLNKA